MNVYHYLHDVNRFTSLHAASRRDEKLLDLLEEPESVATKWKPPRIVPDGVKGRYSDLSDVYSSSPIFNERAWESLRGLIGPFVEILPVRHPTGLPHFAVHVRNVIEALNVPRCKFARYSSGKIMKIDRHVFRQRVIAKNPIFRVPQTPENIYYTDAVLEIVRSEKLTGLCVYDLR